MKTKNRKYSLLTAAVIFWAAVPSVFDHFCDVKIKQRDPDTM
ncbi:hypothetical protein SAMN05421788_107109 [Filimonas lacunae]|uniref:Uncharacterized protein n=1 Tax=Filimonas lacunae TaxID=477680 RepID=A0A173MG99_9BACT|nr:hypothetical protein [Filimonas lacunae]BAV06448.1 hypothetical protein FLA_2467 [Filimonas lacunae]SIT26994.1 hypothetical protein SAMN05421788_107109 [Filimonas lacunae]